MNQFATVYVIILCYFGTVPTVVYFASHLFLPV